MRAPSSFISGGINSPGGRYMSRTLEGHRGHAASPKHHRRRPHRPAVRAESGSEWDFTAAPRVRWAAGSIDRGPPKSAVEELDVLRDGIAPDPQLVGRKVRVAIADGQGADDRKFLRYLQFGSDDVRISRHRDLHACV